MPQPGVERILSIGIPSIDNLQVKFFKLTNLDFSKPDQEYTVGDSNHFFSRPIPTVDFAVPIPHFAVTETIEVVARVQSSSVLTIPLHVQSVEDFYADQMIRYNFAFMFYGAMALMFVYNLFVFISTRFLAYLYYCGYVLSITTLIATQKQTAFQYLWPSNPELSPAFQVLALSAVFPFLLLFARSFLRLEETSPFFNKFISRWIVVQSVYSVVSLLLPYQVSLKTGSLVLTLTSITFIVIAPFLFRTSREAKFFFTAWMFVFCSTFVTVARLNGLIPHNQWTYNSLLIASGFQISLLAFALADRLNQLKRSLSEANSKLQNVNNNLERLVAEKTYDFRSILDNIPIGFFSISDDKCLVLDSKSKYFDDILGGDEGESQNIEDVLLSKSNLEKDQIESLLEALRASIKADPLSFELNQSSFPHEILVNIKGAQRTLEMRWGTVLNQETLQVSKIIGACHDVTDFRAYKEMVVNQSESSKKLVELVSVDQMTFNRFYSASKRSLKYCDELILEQELSKSEWDVCSRYLKVALHTIKGNARTLGLLSLASSVHEAEDSLKNISHHNLNPLHAFKICLSEINGTLEEYMNIAQEKLNRGGEEADRISLPRSYATDLLESIICERKIGKGYLEPVMKVVYVEGENLVSYFVKASKSLAMDLEKHEPEVIVNGFNDLYFKNTCYEAIYDSFTHLLRNSIDHGIERPEDRIAVGKSVRGHIFIECDQIDGQLVIRYRDDGQGLNIEALREKGIERGTLKRGVSYSDAEIAELIFESGLSTAKSVTEISGRGIGMEAVRLSLDKIGGSLVLKLLGSGTQRVPIQFEMTLPPNGFVLLQSLRLSA